MHVNAVVADFINEVQFFYNKMHFEEKNIFHSLIAVKCHLVLPPFVHQFVNKNTFTII